MALLDFRELDLEEIRDVGREGSAGLFGWPVEPDFEVLNSFIRGKGGASEVAGAWHADDAVFAYFHGERAERVFSRWSSGSGHCVGGEESFASWFGADEILGGWDARWY